MHQQQAENKPLRGLIRKYCRMFWETKRKKTEKGGGKFQCPDLLLSSYVTTIPLPPFPSLFVLSPDHILHIFGNTQT